MSQILTPFASTAEAEATAVTRATAPIHVLDEVPAPLPEPLDGDVVATNVLWDRRWTMAALADLCQQLGDRRLFVIEPTPALGLRRVVQWLTSRWLRRRVGHDFDRDLPVDLRRAGLQIFTIERFSVGQTTLRTYFYAELGQRRFERPRPEDEL